MNEVGSGLMIKDTLQGVPVDVSASLIMQLVSDYFKLIEGLKYCVANGYLLSSLDLG